MLYELCHGDLPHALPRSAPRRAQAAGARTGGHRAAPSWRAIFLIVWDIVRFARAQGIRCQGRGSAANSHRRLSARHHQRRPAGAQPALRALSQRRPLHHARHRHRLCRRPPRGGHPVRLPALRARARRHGLQRGDLPGAQRAPRPGQGARASPRPCSTAWPPRLDTTRPPSAAADRSGRDGCAGRSEAASADPPPAAAGRPLRRLDGCPRHLSIHSGGMLITGAAAWTRSCRWSPPPCPGASSCQWDKDSCEDAGLIKIDLLGAAHAGRDQRGVCQSHGRMGEPPPDLRLDAAPGRPGHLRHAPARRHHRRLPGGEPRPAADAAPPQAHLLRGHRRRGGHRAPRADSGRRGASLPAPPRRAGAGDLPPPQPGAGAGRDAGRAALSGAGDPRGGGGGRLYARRGRHAAPGDVAQPQRGGDGGAARALCGRARSARASTTATAEAIFRATGGLCRLSASARATPPALP